MAQEFDYTSHRKLGSLKSLFGKGNLFMTASDTYLYLLTAVPSDSLVRLSNRLLPLNRWTHTKTTYTVNGTYQWLAISSFAHHTPGRWKVMHARREKPQKSVAYLQIDDIEVRVISVKLEKISPKAASPQP